MRIRIVTFLTLALLTLSLQASPKLRLAYADIESFPYQTGQGSALAHPPGIAVELIQQAAANLQIEIELIRLPGSRILKELQAGTLDGGFMYSYQDSRALWAAYPMRGDQPDPHYRLATLDYVLFQRQDSKLRWDGQHFTPSQPVLGANSGYSIVKDLRDAGYLVEEARTTGQNIQKLRSGRIDGYIAQALVVDAYLAQQGITDIHKSSPALRSKDYFLIFSQAFYQQSPQQVQAFWDELARIRDTFTEQAIKRYED